MGTVVVTANRYYGRDGTVYAEQDGGGVVPQIVNLYSPDGLRNFALARAEADRLSALYRTRVVQHFIYPDIWTIKPW
jgi:hypothetical protein